MLTPPAAAHAILFASGEPLEKKQLAKLLEIKDADLPLVLKALADSLKKSGVTLVETESEVELRTAPEATALTEKLRANSFARDLGKGSLETLAVVAYQSGATRGEIDWVRGVNSSASLRTLLMRGLIEGKEDPSDKRRIRYTLTTEALAHLGITHESELPRADELKIKTKAIIDASTDEAVATPA